MHEYQGGIGAFVRLLDVACIPIHRSSLVHRIEVTVRVSVLMGWGTL